MADFGVEFRRVGLLDIGSGNELSGFLNRFSYCRLRFVMGENLLCLAVIRGGIASGRSAE